MVPRPIAARCVAACAPGRSVPARARRAQARVSRRSRGSMLQAFPQRPGSTRPGHWRRWPAITAARSLPVRGCQTQLAQQVVLAFLRVVEYPLVPAVVGRFHNAWSATLRWG